MIIGTDCTYFDQRTPCSVCGARPAMRKTGKCAVHSVTPYDASRVDDWIDCYEGCVKHDPEAAHRDAEKRYEEKRSRSNSARKKVVVRRPEPTKIPTLERLTTMARFPREEANRRIGDALWEAIQSRGISFTTIEEALGYSREYLRNRLRRRVNMDLGLIDICAVLDYLRDFDQHKKVTGYKK